MEGQGGYIDYSGGQPSARQRVRRGSDAADSLRTTSTAPIAGAGAAAGGREGSRSPALARSSSRSDEDDDDAASEHDVNMAGMPIGFLAAMGTPYAKKPIFRTKKCALACLVLLPILLVVVVVIAIFPVLKAVAQHTLNVSVLHIYSSNITQPTNNNFTLTLDGQAAKVGIFPAQIYFKNPVDVYWIDPRDLSEKHLGVFPLDRIGVAAGHGRIRQQTFFQILDEAAFGTFTEFLITQEEFTWRLVSADVQARAFSFLHANHLNFVKDLTLPGIANFTDIAIEDFQLPGDDPQGGITSGVATRLNNPSAFGVQVGTLVIDLFYKGVYLGPVESIGYTNLTAGINHINLQGHLLDFSGNATALAIVSELFSRYLSGEISNVLGVGRSATLPDGRQLSWLSQGIRALNLQIPLQSPDGPINPIKSITIGSFNLVFDANNPYAPFASSNTITGGIALPFGFSLNISNVANEIAIISNGTYVANVTAPPGTSTIRIDSRTAAYTTGTLALELPPSPLQIGPSYSQHLAFDQFTTDLTSLDGREFYLRGFTNATTDTPLGQVTLSMIPFSVPAGLVGLQGLKTAPTLINSVDVVGGTTEFLLLNISVTITNPSNLDITAGDVALQLFNGDTFVGRTILPQLHLQIGTNTLYAVGQFEANNNPVALDTLNRFAQGLPSDLKIQGFNGSTAIQSLTQAFMTLQLNTTLNGLTTRLVNSANLTVLPTTGYVDNAASTVVNLNNPFTSPLVITNIQANATSRGIFVGQIGVALNFIANGRAETTSPDLRFDLNLYPPSLFSLLRQLATEAGLATEQLDGIVQLGGYEYQPTSPPTRSSTDNRKRSFDDLDDEVSWSSFGAENLDDLTLQPVNVHAFGRDRVADSVLVQRDVDAVEGGQLHAAVRLQKRVPNIYTGFNLPTFVQTAFRQLTVNIDLISRVNIGDYSTQLTYTQENVPAYTDDTLLLLLPVLARPIVQKIVDGSILTIDTATITNPQQTTFGTTLVGSIRNAGPFDAVIAFPSGLTVSWNAQTLGQIAMPNVPLEAEVGASLNLQAQFAVASVDYLTEFTRYLLNEPSFAWQITGQNLTVSALGISVDGISISKEVLLAGMNGFRGNVIINDFDLPANDPQGGITLTIATTLTNPSSIGVELSVFGVVNTFGSTTLGPAAATAPFVLQPKSTFQLPLRGRLVPQGSEQGLADVSTLFNGFIHGVPAQLVVNGDSAGPAGVSWLNDGIKSLHIPVILPAAQNLEIIRSITINQLTLMFSTSTAWEPPFSTNNTVAAFQLPFAFPLDITRIQNNITTADGGTDFAQLLVPDSPADTDVVARIIRLQFTDVPFDVFDGTHGTFSQFLTDVTLGESKTFTLKGAADTVAATAVGNLNVQGIGFNVDTNILGLQGLNARPAFVTDLDVFRGYPDYLQINVNAHLYNPSNITIGTGDVAFALDFNNVQIGTADIAGLVLVPLENVIPTAVHYAPQGGAVAQGQLLLENFVQRVPSTTIIAGNQDTTPIESLKQALGSIRLSTVIPPLEQNLVTRTVLTLPRDIARTSIASVTFNLANPFTASINLVRVIANATYEGIYLGQINEQSLSPPIRAPGHTEITSPVLPFRFNLDPKALIRFIFAAAANTGTSLGPDVPALFNYVLGLASTETAVTSQPATSPATCVSGKQFDIEGAILRSLVGLTTNLTIQSTLLLDEYRTDLNFIQYEVPTQTDETALYLIGVVGAPIVQYLVDRATLTFSEGNITRVTNNGFQVDLRGQLLGTGPFDALISFPEPVTVTWEGRNIARIQLPDLCAAANDGIPNLVTTGQLTITDKAGFTEFATYILHNPGFTWTISSPRLRVTALNTIFDNVLITKQISFLAFNNLPNVTIFNFDLPRDDPAGGITIETGARIPSPSNLGIELGQANFRAYFMGNEVGPIGASDLFLAPLTTTETVLNGRIIPQRGDGLRTLGILFSRFLLDQDQILNVRGESVISPAQPNSPVDWLTAAFRTLTLDVILPGENYQIIFSISIADLEITIETQAQAYAVLTSNQYTEAIYANPFGFSLRALRTSPDLTIRFPVGGPDTAQLTLPDEPVVSAGTSTGNRVPLVINWQDETLRSLNNGQFNAFFRQVAIEAQATFDLVGGTGVLARTAAGDIPITRIPINVTSSLDGLNNFGGVAEVPGVPPVVGSGGYNDLYGTSFGSDFIRLPLTVILNNPSNLTIHTNTVSFQIVYRGTNAGRAVIDRLDLVPGRNNITAQAHYAPLDPANEIAQDLLTQYLEVGTQIPLVVAGDQDSTPFGSLKDAFDDVQLTTSIQGANIRLVQKVTIYLDLIEAVCRQTTSITFDARNTLDADVLINILGNTASQGNTIYATFEHRFLPAFRLPVDQTVTSERIYNVTLNQGALGSLPLFLGFSRGLDLANRINLNVQEPNGYNVPGLVYRQPAVPYEFRFVLDNNPISDLIGEVVGGDFLAAIRTFLGLSSCIGGLFVAPNTTIPGLPAPLSSLVRIVQPTSTNISIPSVSLPSISIPSVSIPSVSIPGVTLPTFNIPGVGSTRGAGDDDTATRTSTAATTTTGNGFGFTLPTFGLPTKRALPEDEPVLAQKREEPLPGPKTPIPTNADGRPMYDQETVERVKEFLMQQIQARRLGLIRDDE